MKEKVVILILIDEYECTSCVSATFRRRGEATLGIGIVDHTVELRSMWWHVFAVPDRSGFAALTVMYIWCGCGSAHGVMED